ncbi:unnamed protein product [Phytophthora fragariaefolia]|uniref:Unnamed protein product n=1 Tax=Phytophthora fragariaefolia TaxID=1490495 RepID=A0A9W6Y2D9_9STRA|nr:unnamed protein product [Phytophthora fragariaefolia]
MRALYTDRKADLPFRRGGLMLRRIFLTPPRDRSMEQEAALQLLAIETRRLDFEVAKWKQQQALRREALQLKAEEIALKEATTRQRQQTHVMELRAKLLKALDEAGAPPAQTREYLALLDG